MHQKVHAGQPFVAIRNRPPASSTGKSRSSVHSEEYARQFAWIDWLLAKTGKTDATLAKDVGLAVNYIYRKRADGTVLGATQIRMLTDYYEVPGPDTYQLPGFGGLSDEGAPYSAISAADPVFRTLVETALRDRPNAASWHLRTTALKGEGYMPGDILIADGAIMPQAGDVVVAQVYDLRRGTADTIFRIFEPPYLVAASFEASLRKPLLVDNERVVVMATVTQTFRERRGS